jgi:hypothetical protein
MKVCCDGCKRRDKNNGKSCVCVVPANQRKVNLKEIGGCRTCGCNGCTREDLINNNNNNNNNISSNNISSNNISNNNNNNNNNNSNHHHNNNNHHI